MDLVLMFAAQQYSLIDFGDGEKLEQFGQYVIRRETPSISSDRGWQKDKRQWKSDAVFAQNRYDDDPNGLRTAGSPVRKPSTRSARWAKDVDSASAPSIGKDWSVEHQGKRFLLKLAPSGQVGVFPEQATNWQWIERQSERLSGLNAINLFGYTGGTTMALAKCGVSVTHVDASKSVVKWARDNTMASGLADAPVRWIVDDAMSFMQREVKRGQQYQIVIADPPSFGRGPKGNVWKIQRDLPKLLKLTDQISAGALQMLVLSCHTPGITAAQLRQHARRVGGIDGGSGEAITLKLKCRASNQPLNSGECFRWHA